MWLVLLLGGCVTYAPADLSFVSVKRQYMTDEEWGRSYSLNVEFTSSTDLPYFAAKRSLTLGGEGFFCEKPERRVLLSYPSIYEDGRPYEGGMGRLPPPQRSAPPYRYNVFLTVFGADAIGTKSPAEGADLPKEAEDLCFYLRGANQGGFGYRSNVVVVPKAATKEALRPPAR